MLSKFLDLTVRILGGQPNRLWVLLTFRMPAAFGCDLVQISIRHLEPQIEIYGIQNRILGEMAASEVIMLKPETEHYVEHTCRNPRAR